MFKTLIKMASPIQHDPQHYRGLVDMGSNGIRFSITSLQPPTQRIMPTLYQHRAGISLYDAQYSESGERVPIDQATIKAVIASFKQFKRTCQDFEVPDKHITVLATEATRTAINSEDFRAQIKQKVGWDVTMLPKEDEGRVGAMGIASSLPEVSGLVMDLGGGSTQLSWLIKRGDTHGVQMPESGAVSMPYGAAAMSRRLAEAERNGTTAQLKKEIKTAVTDAYATLKVPAELEAAAQKSGGFTLYLSGGGFRGWGYVLMSQHRVQPYPIPAINGFKVSRREFLSTDQVKAAAAKSLETGGESELFRISERRAGQVPAVALLVNVLAEALPQVKEVRFCQGGVREGYLFSSLSEEIRAQYPLVVATQPLASHSSAPLVELLLASLPEGPTNGAVDDYKSIFVPELLEAFANLIYHHSSHSKDLQASAALRTTTSGVLAGVHGITHEARTLIALLLCARWGGSIPPCDEPFKRTLEQLADSPWTLWWINYIGAVAALISGVHPSGVRDADRLQLRASWGQDEKRRQVLSLHATITADVDEDVFGVDAHGVEKVGKRKRWIGGRDGIGHRAAVDITAADGRTLTRSIEKDE
ncbi:Retrograde regulation protein 2 [Fulvia fulva]|uniref:Retrograde regulation protein 2 n=1 Tax=Passalora fulva TaxID=5499 RepID=A0A9Q8UTP1_PASFU|nr:Retrograde regulation protein 2 [Fulvia fulva]KAK4613690.1 Retrograde regulation protein 2 [Fulvia fulva]KAK4614586.1 Retrograde regulation protein 2 [Fulvia fulva]UJO21987.1 Retrograde regulation protein 2 [Fulvia fulva]WPV20337.1 Retrograde regulation protein 2 [Fulvia fulva]WPV35642.1 Retrograde regulation protein 2 [Fulvia fulva]